MKSIQEDVQTLIGLDVSKEQNGWISRGGATLSLMTNLVLSQCTVTKRAVIIKHPVWNHLHCVWRDPALCADSFPAVFSMGDNRVEVLEYRAKPHSLHARGCSAVVESGIVSG